jgi:Protein of unknown function
VTEDGAIRTLEGGKRLVTRNEDYYDNQIISFASHQFQKASRMATQTLNRYNLPVSDYFIGWRLRKMVDIGRLQIQGELTRTLKDFEVKLPGDGADAQLNLAV